MIKKIVCCIIFLLFSACSRDPNIKQTFSQDIMYTSFDISVYSSLPTYILNHRLKKVWKKLHYLDEELSPAGKGMLGRLNKKGIILRKKNPYIFDILSNFITISRQINQQSEGAFDLTVYPLVRLWGFYVQDKGNKVPSEKEISNVLKLVGMDKIKIESNQIMLEPDVKIDVGAIAKGYAVDIAMQMLTNIPGVYAGIVNAGGNLRVFGRKPDGSDWRVGIKNPNNQNIEEVVTLYDGDAIATSGDYERYFVVDDIYYHHIFNPKTGKPVTHKLASVSVIVKESAEMADILATTLLSLGKTQAVQFVEKKNIQNIEEEIPLFFIERNGAKLIISENALWRKRR